ncbi:MAG: thioredoxin-disulfide reductase [Bacteroidales bacterium]|nr:thioredoxin-disulfide reductase [Bacteroidales bacterium]
MATTHTQCLIIGSGPAGYTAGIYLSRAGVKSIIIAGPQQGGQLTDTHEIENYPAFPEPIGGYDLMQLMEQQAVKFGTELITGEIVNADFSQRPFQLTTDSGDIYTADAVIVATGATAKYTGLPAEQKYRGQGVSACAVCDGFFYRKQDVIVVGGGDTAVGDAIYLSKICNKVYLAVRKPYLRASKILQDRMKEIPNIELLTEHVVTDIFGENGVEGVEVVFRRGTSDETSRKIPVTGYFAAVGRKPQTDFLAGQIEMDDNGYIITKNHSTSTNIPGVFAAGDCADPIYRQAVVAAGSGCKSALDVEKFLNKN